MKATFFGMATLALSAFAAPAPIVDDVVQQLPAGQAGDALKILDDVLVQKLGVGEIVDAATGSSSSNKAVEGVPTDAESLLKVLSDLVDTVTSQTESINQTVAKAEDGSCSKEEARTEAIVEFEQMQFALTQVVTQLTGAAGIDVSDIQVDAVLSLVVILVSQVLATVQAVVTTLGIRAQLASLVASVLNLVAGLLVLVIGLVAAIVPGLLAALSPILAGLGQGLLAPLLTPIVALLAGLTLSGLPIA